MSRVIAYKTSCNKPGPVREVTVASRPRVRLVPVATVAWRSWDDVAELFDGPGDAGRQHDRDLVDQHLVDPWSIGWSDRT